MTLLLIPCLFGLGSGAQAASEAERLSSGAKDAFVRARALLWLAKYDCYLRKWHEAAEKFSRYQKLRPAASDAPWALVRSVEASVASGDYDDAVRTAGLLLEKYPASPECSRALVLQGEANMALAKFKDAAECFEKVGEDAPEEVRLRARRLRADAFYAEGADNPRSYEKALAAYQQLMKGAQLDDSGRLTVSARIGRTLEKLRRPEDARAVYYRDVIEVYWQGAGKGVVFDEDARAAFVQSAFRLAEEDERTGNERGAVKILEYVADSRLPAAAEARSRIERIRRKGMLP